MTSLESLLRQAVEILRAQGASFALVGGLAVSVRSEPRFTKDIDLAVAATGEPDAERLVSSFLAHGFGLTHQIEQEATGRLATVRLAAPGSTSEGPVVDLLFASSGIEPEIVSAAETLTVLPGCDLPVASRAHLLATKLLSRDDATRPQDRVDAVNLVRLLDADERAQIREALDLIRARGFHRNRDLARELDRLRDEAGLWARGGQGDRSPENRA